MTEIEKEVQRPNEAAAEVTQQATQVRPEDVKTLADVRTLLVQTEQGLIGWAQKKIQETNYVQAVQTELAMHKGDAHSFMIHRLIDFAEKQEARIEALETLLAKAVVGISTKKDK